MEDTDPPSPENPNAYQSYVMVYASNGTYKYVNIDGQRYNGTYTYSLQPDGRGLIASDEMDGTTPVKYTLTLTCSTDTAGTYVYQQTAGTAPSQRSNNSKYALVP
ncbi:hypothetical protein MSTE_02509 [Mycobacteroides stephanolepidis]|uniref:Uncharacterized protein n=2 Tax=[Mycobacterium] stephanolepidis TaxID=1520670 RepID=A0A1Z4EXY5_9MYCO|nr:hypothetical protein MSTE_02509 [[Mycobacterium] stephanolepidis]